MYLTKLYFGLRLCKSMDINCPRRNNYTIPYLHQQTVTKNIIDYTFAKIAQIGSINVF